MKCEVGVHTGSITFVIREHDWKNLLMAMPAKVGFRRWTAMEMDGRLRFSRTQFQGAVPSSVQSHVKPGFMRMHMQAATIVRCAQIERHVNIMSNSHFELEMPPHHLWPWIKDTGGRTSAPIETRRWQLVQEVNARIRSCIKHHCDFPTNVPLWASRMMTEFEWQKVHANEEIS